MVALITLYRSLNGVTEAHTIAFLKSVICFYLKAVSFLKQAWISCQTAGQDASKSVASTAALSLRKPIQYRGQELSICFQTQFNGNTQKSPGECGWQLTLQYFPGMRNMALHLNGIYMATSYLYFLPRGKKRPLSHVIFALQANTMIYPLHVGTLSLN